MNYYSYRKLVAKVSFKKVAQPPPPATHRGQSTPSLSYWPEGMSPRTTWTTWVFPEMLPLVSCESVEIAQCSTGINSPCQAFATFLNTF